MSFQKIILAIVLIAAVLLGGYWVSSQKTKTKQTDLLTFVKEGPFSISVTATGELKAERSLKIRGPQGMRSSGIWRTTISDLIPEGTVVKEGDYVAALDKTELADKMNEAGTEIEKIQTQLEQAKIDTAIELRGLRDEMINLGFAKKEKVLQVEQSKYEPQMVIQQAEIELEKTERDYNQLVSKYALKQEQAQAKISEINALMRQNQMKLTRLKDLAEQFTIKAPKDGMVIYARSWDGKKGPGSQISGWDPVVAELPDLTDMVSQSYVNEVDVSKVKNGQDVQLKVDAFPDHSYTGRVVKVANIGEQLRGSDSKVFEVMIEVNEVDSILRPAMTTRNEIITEVFEKVVHIPLEALHSDSIVYVFKQVNGEVVKQEVVSGLTNANEVIIDYGLQAGDPVLLSLPENPGQIPIIPLDPAIKEKIRLQQEAEEKTRQARMLEKMKEVKKENFSRETESGGGFRIIMN